MIIDVHAHYYPQPYLEAIGRTDMPSPAAAPLGGQSIEERLALMDTVGVDRQILSVSQAQPYLSDARDAAAAAQLGNDLYDELCQRYPERFSYFAALPLAHMDETLAEIERVSASRHVVGYTIGCSVGDLQLDDPFFTPLYEELDRRASTLFLHPVGQGRASFLAGQNLAWSVGATFEDTAAALRLVYADVPSRFAHLSIIVPHLGGTLPFLLARLVRKGGESIVAGLRSFYYDTVSGSPDALRCTCTSFGADRLLFGTDYPFCDADEFAEHLRYLNDVGLSATELDAIHATIAEELLHLVS